MLTRDYFEKYINNIEIPENDQQNVMALLTGEDKVLTMEERIEDLRNQLETNLVKAYESIESMSGSFALSLYKEIEYAINEYDRNKDIIVSKIARYDNGEESADMIRDFITLGVGSHYETKEIK